MIFSYSRAQAIEAGVLVNLTSGPETGFKIPVACTSAIWHQYIVPPAGTRELGQSERGRDHDFLWMTYLAIRRSKTKEPTEDRLRYNVIVLQAPNKHETIALTAICGPGDKGEPVLTIMMPDED